MVQKIAITVDEKSLHAIDRLVKEGRFRNRSKAVQSALDLLAEKDRLVQQLDKLDPVEEQAFAEQGLG